MRSAILILNKLLPYDGFSLKELSLDQGRLYVEGVYRCDLNRENRPIEALITTKIACKVCFWYSYAYCFIKTF